MMGDKRVIGFAIDEYRDEIREVMDTDQMTVQRLGEGDRLETLYNRVPCHINIESTDAVAPAFQPVIPIIVNLKIYYDDTKYVLQNNDVLTLYRLDSTGNIVRNVYRGRGTNPMTDQSGAAVRATMETLGQAPIIPSPDDAVVVVNFYVGSRATGEILRPPLDFFAKIGETVNITIPEVAGHVLSDVWLDGLDIVDDPQVSFEVTKGTHVVDAYFEIKTGISYFRQLIFGDYETDNLVFNTGFHLFRRLHFNIEEETADGLVVLSDFDRYNHRFMGEIRINVGSIFKAFMTNEWFKVVHATRSGSQFRLVMERYTPTSQEEQATIITRFD